MSRASRSTWCSSSRASPTSGWWASRRRASRHSSRSLSAARPKIADYPFTTLVPNLGVVQAGDDTFVVADVPGLIPGAATGKGLGLKFLRHIERCAVLAHVVDCAALETERDPVSDLDAIEAELAAYGGLEDRPRVIVLNKMDVPEARDLAEIVRPDLAARGWPVFEVSAVSHEGLRELTFALAGLVADAPRMPRPRREPTRIVLRPQAVDDTGFSIEPQPDGSFVVHGARPERWVRQTNFDNEEAVGYLADRLARLGVEDALAKAGAEPGCLVRIGTFEFDWQPTVYAGAQFTPGQRGADYRLAEYREDGAARPSAAQRLAARKARRRPYEDNDQHQASDPRKRASRPRTHRMRIESRHFDDVDVRALVTEQQRELTEAEGDGHVVFPLNEQIEFVVGFVDGAPVACGALQQLGDRIGEVKRMYVVPLMRGKGLSRRILAELEELAVRRGLHTLRLETGAFLAPAVGLYTSSGYTEIPPFGQYTGHPASVCYEKAI